MFITKQNLIKSSSYLRYCSTTNSNNINSNNSSNSSISSVYQTFKKYDFLKRNLSNRDIWIPPLVTNNNYSPEEKDILPIIKSQLKASIIGLSDSNSKSNNNNNNYNGVVKTLEKNILVSTNERVDRNAHLKLNSEKDFTKENLDRFSKYFESDTTKNRFTSTWTQQLLPNSYKIDNTVSDQTNESFNYLYPILSFLDAYHSDQFHYTFHCLTTESIAGEVNDGGGEGKQMKKVKSIQRRLANKLKDTRKRIFKKMVKPFDQGLSVEKANLDTAALDPLKSPHQAFFIVQLLLTNNDDLYISVNRSLYNQLWSLPLPFNQGVVHIDRDLKPPSRAYKKLIESFSILGTIPQPNDICVDLGSSPGGWISILSRLYKQHTTDKLCIFSIDRSPLEQGLEKDIHRHLITDGMKWRLTSDDISQSTNTDANIWLFNDMAIPPNKSCQVLDAWIKSGKVNYFVWAIKFIGDTEYNNTLELITKIMKDNNITTYCTKHLLNQGNEIMIIGKV
ncbi:hypothetical protein CYY_000561 [Polysphondylium violaceum]|uniref:Ribosomal RNA methyltransferase FtsJ domain-containing protein n=1 Tax=Polysphondylium violaceum TaxID=133409 RepID=A0A8J4Q4K0_9MYCE|nr:hypothetical protein CYY_000561 [Polysphondylium violaceum]